ncbi:metallophosphoesterase family protein [Haliovirga abyssi]|uniref:Calcineurin-like phosphoesterase domain-containing protein n=1 Tax=Haliovirga abyssi TaxID=2996794 RepID=A0AAU9DU06_9FUSO|nr:exonuclease SbcCD subunit D [Haliovirga abyssi]BDU50709.1 hypothetical protein HLVA_12780 [Haliovirga abyssi]
MKIMHISDIHLGRKPVGGQGLFAKKRYEDYFKAFRKAIEIAIEKKVDTVLIAGDIFDKKELYPEVLEKTENILKNLKENNINCVVIEGNHDNIYFNKEVESWIIYLEKKGYFKRPTYYFENEKYIFEPVIINNIYFWGVGYPGAFVDEVLLELSDFIDEKEENIILVHTGIAKNDFLAGTINGDILNNFKGKVKYIAGGHLHSYAEYPKENPYFFLPGSLEYWDLAENGEKKGAIIFDTETMEREFITFKDFIRKKIDIKFEVESNNINQFQEEFIKKIEDIKIEKEEDIVIVEMTFKKYFFIDINWCEKALEEKGALKAIVKSKYPKIEKQGSIGDISKNIEEIEKDIIIEWENDFSANSEETVKVLEKLKNLQEEKQEDIFIDTFDQFLEKIVQS